ncbi:MAG TPA: hypothetical protein VJO35_04535 [Terriglobales bacterium]|nr:hypothetical protein [Terriglobales bacterium]
MSSPPSPPSPAPDQPSPEQSSPVISEATPASETTTATPSSPQTDFNIGEEYGTARKNLPPARILAICLAVVAVIVAAYALTHRAHALSSGTIDDVVAVPIPGQDMVMVAINVSLQNNSEQSSKIHTIEVAADTPTGKYTDDASPAVDAQRYFQAFPALKQNARNFLQTETVLQPGGKLSGTIVVSYPVNIDVFNSRKSLTVTIAPYDQVPVVITK